MDLDVLFALARKTAHEAGALVEKRRRSAFAVSAKSSANDIVTEVDRESEALIVSRILAARPEDAIVGEEGTGHPVHK